MRKVLEMSDIDPSRVAQELVEQKKLEGVTHLLDAFRVIREGYDVSDVELIQVIRELRVVHEVSFDRYVEFEEDPDQPGTHWIIPMPNALP